MSDKILNKIKYSIIKRKHPFSILVRELDLNPEEQMLIIEVLRKDGYVSSPDGEYYYKNNNSSIINHSYFISYPSNHYKLCLLSDTHLTSIHDRIPILNYIYEKGEKEKIDFFIHSGDFFEGFVSRNQNPETSLRVTDLEAQINYADKNYPKSSIPTIAIGGNHEDETYRLSHRNLIEELVKRREKIIYLGQNQATVQIGKLRIYMVHGTTRKLERKVFLIKNELNSYNEKTIPQLVTTGHTHEAFYFPYLNSHVFQCPALMNCSDPQLFKNKVTNNGIWWIEFDLSNNGIIKNLHQELESFPCEYVKKRY